MGIDPVSLAITVALNAAAMGMAAMRKIEGPRLTDLSVTVADYGTPLNYFRGMRRLEVPCFYAEPIKERKKKRKTKGGKYKDYTYFGTFGVAVADQPIDGVNRIWFDRHLVYDQLTGKSVFELHDGYELDAFMRIYLGTETQDPDPRMLATVEAEEGPGTCPAYLGISYIFFEDIPLEKLGNRFPQVSVEAIRGGTPIWPYVDFGINTARFGLSPDQTRIVANYGSDVDYVYIIDTGTLEATDLILRDPEPNASRYQIAVADDGLFYGFSLDDGNIYAFQDSGGGTLLFDSGPEYAALSVVEVDGTNYVLAGNASGYYSVGAAENLLDDGLQIHTFFADQDGAFWAVCASGTPPINEVVFNRVSLGPGVGRVVVSGLPNQSLGPSGAFHYRTGGLDQFVFWGDGWLYAVDRTTGDILQSVNTGNLQGPDFRNLDLDSETIWSTLKEYRLADLTLIRSLPHDTWFGTANFSTNYAVTYDRGKNALWGVIGNNIHLLYLDRIQNDGVLLSDICSDVAELAGMSSLDFDFSDLNQRIPGYSWSQGPGRDIISPLLEVYDSDIRPHGFLQQGLKRGQAADGTIETEWLVRDGEEPLYRTPITGDSDLPRRIFVTFSDLNAEQQSNTAAAQRNAASVATVREMSIDMTPLAITAAEAQELVERKLRREWLASVKAEARLTPRELLLEPGDVRDLVLDGETLRCRLVQMTIRPNRDIETRWERDAASVNTILAAPGAEAAGRPEPVVYEPVSSQGFVLDIPLVSDLHDQTTPFLYIASGPDAEGAWPGTDFWQSDSGTSSSYVSGWDGVASGEDVTWGTVPGILPETATDIMDEATQVFVDLANGTLESVTEDELLADQTINLALVGSELIQFRDAVLQSDGGYVLQGLIRGVRGTEQYVGSHVAGEHFVFISSVVKRHDMGASEIGDTDFYKVGTLGFNVDDVAAIEVPFTAAANRPYSPAAAELFRDDITGDWAISWTRRTRIGGSTLNGQDVPLGETSESYRVRILDEEDAVVRTIESTVDAATYTQAQQTADWGSGQMHLSVEIVQMSPSLSLEGFPALVSA